MHLFIFSCFLASCERGRFTGNSIVYYVWGEPEIMQWRVRKVSCTLGWHRVLTRRMWAALTGIIITACITPFLHANCLFPVTPGRHLITSPCCGEWTTQEGLALPTESRNWILLPTHEEQGLRRVFSSSLPTATFEGQRNPGGWPALHPVLLHGPEVVQAWRNPVTCSAQEDLPGPGFSVSLQEDLPLCCFQTYCFLSCCGFAAVVLLPHHFSGHS